MLLVAPDSPILHRPCSGSVVTRKQIDDMFRLMYSLEGAGLAAPQVGIDARLFVTAWGEVFIDPIIDCGADYTDVEEGCLSLPGVVVKKRRLLRIQLLDGRTYINEQAIVIQHEIDHLKGILIND